MTELAEVLRPTTQLTDAAHALPTTLSGERTDVAVALTTDLLARITVLTSAMMGDG